MGAFFLINVIQPGVLLAIWLLFMFGAAVINQYTGRLVNGSKGFLILLLLLLFVDASVLLTSPGYSSYLVGQLIGTYLFTAALPSLVAWWFSRKRGKGIDPQTGLMATRGLTRWLRVLLGAQVLLSLAAVVSFAMEYHLASQVLANAYASSVEALFESMASDRRLRLIEGLGVVLYIACAVALFKWLYRSNHNARQLGAQGMRFGSRWAVGWFFVPLFQLWKPFQVVKELLQASQAPEAWKTVRVGALLPLWWALFVLDKFVGAAVPFALDHSQGFRTLQFNDLVLGFFQVTEALLAVSTLLLVNRVYRDQSRQQGHSSPSPAPAVAPVS